MRVLWFCSVGMFHVLWNVAKMVVRAFSGVGLTEMALELGAVYLDQFERAASFRATMRVFSAVWVALLATLPNDDEDTEDEERHSQLRVLRLLRDTVGRVVIAHRAARSGNHGLFYAALCALAPIAPATGSFKYAALFARWTYSIQGIATDAAEHIRTQLASWPGARLSVGGAVLHFDELMEEAIRFLKGVTSQRHLRDAHALAAHFTHAQRRHEWMAEFFAAVRSDHVARTTRASAHRRSADVARLVPVLTDVFASGRPSDAPLFATSVYLRNAGARTKLLRAFKIGAERLVVKIRQLVTRTEPIDSTGAKVKNVPEFFSVGAAVSAARLRGGSTHDVAARALVNAAESFFQADLSRMRTEDEKTAAMADMLRAAAGPYPHTLANPDGTKTPSTQETTMPVLASMSTATPEMAAGATVETAGAAAVVAVAAADTHAIDALQLLMAEASSTAVRTVAWLAGRLVERVLALLPPAARHVYLCFPRPGLLPSPWSAPTPTASVHTTRARARRTSAAAAERTVSLAMLGADARVRRGVVHALVPLLLRHAWPVSLEVTVDAEAEDDPAAAPVSVRDGQAVVRPDLAHAVGESSGAVWLLLRAAGRGGVVHSSDAQAVDWGMHVAMADRAQTYLLRYTGTRTLHINVGALLAALEAGTAGAGERRLPDSWTPQQRVQSVLVAKALAGNVWHEALGTVSAGAVVQLLFDHAHTIGPLWHAYANAVNADAAHRLVLRVFFESGGLRRQGLAMPYPDGASDAALNEAHTRLAGQLLRAHQHRRGRPIGHGLLPPPRAVRLSIARASTYLAYVAQGVRTPCTRFLGWAATDGGYAVVNGGLLVHWDDNDDGTRVLGPSPPPPAGTATTQRPSTHQAVAAARASKRAAPLSARPSPVSSSQRPRFDGGQASAD
jgi:hypothetical protein